MRMWELRSVRLSLKHLQTSRLSKVTQVDKC